MRQVWEYVNSANQTVRGVFLKYTHRGGADVTYWFHRLKDDNETLITYDGGGICVDLINGPRLKLARNVTVSNPVVKG